MRSVWTAATSFGVMTVSAILAGSGALAGCNYDNPGFKVKGTVGAQESTGGSAEVTTDVVTTQSSGTPTVTSEPTGPASEPVTSVTTLDTSGSETSSVSTSSGTGSEGEWVFPESCGETIPGEYEPAAADTFFLYEQGIGACSFDEQMIDCFNREFSLVDYYPLFHHLKEPGPDDDIVDMYAVRFAMPAPMYMGEVPVPPHAFQSFDARFHVFRISPGDPWKQVDLSVLRLAAGDTWQEGGGQEYTPCLSPAASFRCRECPLSDPEGGCVLDWSVKETPVPLNAPALQKLVIKEAPGDSGADVPLKQFVKADLAWLITEGLVVFAPGEMAEKLIEVKTLQSGDMSWRPALRTNYCEPTFVKN